ncbi:hypothetical protein F5144DRAFT_603773 [Chaetomium tenue]|uniref:Uncharacterized protein n=1 Tax=Chaetomium tenue TaxID=1854479 RepID=A0ACB7P5B9_9PEZI|nr:hypothetical protein F5144DRAFT_603773 [Chaetomium globosum]
MPPVINSKTNPLQAAVKALTKKADDSSSTQERREPWRNLDKFKSTEDNVKVDKVRDMRLFERPP